MPVLKFPQHRNNDSIYIKSWLQELISPHSSQTFKRPKKKIINLDSNSNSKKLRNKQKSKKAFRSTISNAFSGATVLVNPQEQYMCKIIKFYNVENYNVVGLLRDKTNSILFCL